MNRILKVEIGEIAWKVQICLQEGNLRGIETEGSEKEEGAIKETLFRLVPLTQRTNRTLPELIIL